MTEPIDEVLKALICGEIIRTNRGLDYRMIDGKILVSVGGSPWYPAGQQLPEYLYNVKKIELPQRYDSKECRI